MQAAVSAGAYGNNNTDTKYATEFGRPITDFYRFWSHGRDGFSDPGLGLSYYFQPNSFSWEHSINLYNVNDYALGAWDTNNFLKGAFVQPPIWPYDYTFEAGDGENENNDIFTRHPDVGTPVVLDLALPNGQPGTNAYEILAFYGIAASLPVGTKEVSYFDTNLDLENFTMPGGSDIRLNHSYEFNHDAASTWNFYELLKTELGFSATHGSGAIVEASLAAMERASHKPEISGEMDAAISNDLALSLSLASAMSVSQTIGFVKRLKAPIHLTNTLSALSGRTDRNLPALVRKDSSAEGTLFANELIGDDEDMQDEVIAIDGFFDGLGNAVAPVPG